MAIKRIYVHESIYDEFLAAVTGFLDAVKTGDYTDAEAFFGPIQNKMQFEKLQKLYEEVYKQGWKRAYGSAPEKREKGYFIHPVLIDNPPEDSLIVQTEPFGPIV